MDKIEREKEKRKKLFLYDMMIFCLFIDINQISTIFSSFGYLSIFLICFVASIIIFVPIPYFPVLIAAAFSGHLNPILISLSGAIGTTAAKIVIFYASYYYERDILGFKKKKKKKSSILPLEKFLSRYAWIGAFTAALIPIPDLVSVPLGMTKYNPWKFASAIFTGKFMFNTIVVWMAIILGRVFIKHWLSLLGLSPSSATQVTIPSSSFYLYN